MTRSLPIRQVAIAVILDHHKVVVGPRPAHAHLAGYWEFPGGQVEAGESLAQTASREAREETGLTIKVGDLLAEATISTDDCQLMLSFLACTPTHPGDPTPPFRWIDCDLLRTFLFPPANQAVIELLSPKAT